MLGNTIESRTRFWDSFVSIATFNMLTVSLLGWRWSSRTPGFPRTQRWQSEYQTKVNFSWPVHLSCKQALSLSTFAFYWIFVVFFYVIWVFFVYFCVVFYLSVRFLGWHFGFVLYLSNAAVLLDNHKIESAIYNIKGNAYRREQFACTIRFFLISASCRHCWANPVTPRTKVFGHYTPSYPNIFISRKCSSTHVFQYVDSQKLFHVKLLPKLLYIYIIILKCITLSGAPDIVNRLLVLDGLMLGDFSDLRGFKLGWVSSTKCCDLLGSLYFNGVFILSQGEDGDDGPAGPPGPSGPRVSNGYF